MPNYVPSMLSRLCPSGCGLASFPAVYTPPVSYSDPSLHLSPSSTITLSTPVSPAEKTWIQQVVGSLFLFYARALDLSVLSAVCQVSSHQSNPTQHELASAHRLLNYVSSHRNTQKLSTPLPSLPGPVPTPATCPDLSSGLIGRARRPHPAFLTPQKATDKAKELNRPLSAPPTFYIPTHPLTYPPLSVTHNLPLHAFCQRIPVVVASVAEAEYAAVFGGGQVSVELTLTLTNLGHPQQSLPLLFVDNECAIGLAISSVRPKKSKSIDMRLDWAD
jgi:hypothetical protein